MSDFFPYLASVGKLTKLMSKILKKEIPDKLNRAWFDARGFDKSNDLSMSYLLKFIGFVDKAKKPTHIWYKYQSENPKKVLGKAIRKNYQKLFSKYPDANTRSKAEITEYIREYSTLEDEEITKANKTFFILCSLADFGDESKSEENEKEVESPKIDNNEIVISKPISDAKMNITIQLILPETKDEEVYDKLFSSMKKHLISNY